jgi:hypothetical protein
MSPVAAVTASLADSLRGYGLADPDIRISTATRIEPHAATGKLKRLVARFHPAGRATSTCASLLSCQTRLIR